MSNNSTSAGCLLPTSSGPDYDAALEQVLASWLSALTGLTKQAVTADPASGQAEPSAAEVNACRFGITEIQADDSVALVQQENGRYDLWRQEIVACLVSFYGPQAQQTAALLRDGIAVSQNNAMLNASGLSLYDVSTLKLASAPNGNPQVRRYDLTLRLGRKVVREYGITTLADAPVTLLGE